MIIRLLLWLLPTRFLVAALCSRRDFAGLIVFRMKQDGFAGDKWAWGLQGIETREEAWAMLDDVHKQVLRAVPGTEERAAKGAK